MQRDPECHSGKHICFQIKMSLDTKGGFPAMVHVGPRCWVVLQRDWSFVEGGCGAGPLTRSFGCGNGGGAGRATGPFLLKFQK